VERECKWTAVGCLRLTATLWSRDVEGMPVPEKLTDAEIEAIAERVFGKLVGRLLNPAVDEESAQVAAVREARRAAEQDIVGGRAARAAQRKARRPGG